MRGFRRRILEQSLGFVRRYRRALRPTQMAIALTSPTLLCLYTQATSYGSLRHPAPRRTYLATTEDLDPLYAPAFPVASRYAHYFKPTMLTNDAGSISDELAEFCAFVFCPGGFRRLDMSFEQFLLVTAVLKTARLANGPRSSRWGNLLR